MRVQNSSGTMSRHFQTQERIPSFRLPDMGDKRFRLKGAGCDKGYKNEECDYYCRRRTVQLRACQHLFAEPLLYSIRCCCYDSSISFSPASASSYDTVPNCLTLFREQSRAEKIELTRPEYQVLRDNVRQASENARPVTVRSHLKSEL